MVNSEKDKIRSYAEDRLGEEIVHVERAGSELVGPRRHDIWDVHCADSRWWVLSNPTRHYSQEDFKSRDVVLTFHVGFDDAGMVAAGAACAGCTGACGDAARIMASLAAGVRGIRRR